MLSQGEQQRSLMDEDSDDGSGDLTRDLNQALATSTVRYQDSDEVRCRLVYLWECCLVVF